MPDCVLDASAALALLYREPGAGVVERHLEGASMSTVNYSECIAHLTRFGATLEVASSRMAALTLRLVPLDASLALACAGLWAPTRELGLSLGDRACLALAQALGQPVLTTDRAWARLRLGMEVRLIR
jgi:PIN domain nuclease of toxin-antitoxin system